MLQAHSPLYSQGVLAATASHCPHSPFRLHDAQSMYQSLLRAPQPRAVAGAGGASCDNEAVAGVHGQACSSTYLFLRSFDPKSQRDWLNPPMVAGTRLYSPAGLQTRPMMEKVRGALFSMLLAGSAGRYTFPAASRWLDLYAGTVRPRAAAPLCAWLLAATTPARLHCAEHLWHASSILSPVSYTHLTLPTTPYV